MPLYRCNITNGITNGARMSMVNAIGAVFGREIRLNLDSSGGAYLPTAFFAGAILMLPFSLGPDVETLRKIGPGFLWLALSLASLVSLERLFQSDLDDGNLDQLIICQVPLPIIVLAKLLGQFVAIIIPLLFALPLAALLLNIEPRFILGLCVQLFIGALAMFLVGGIGAGLGAGIKRGGLLVALLALPLYTPIVIFGASSANLLVMGADLFSQGFLFICAITMFGLVLSPIAIAVALRLHVD